MKIASFNLSDDFIDVSLEKALLLALSKDSSLYWQFVDKLREDTFARKSDSWSQLVKAYEEEGAIPDFPIDWGSKEDPKEIIQKLNDLFQRRMLAKMQERLGSALYDSSLKADSLAQMLTEEAFRINSVVKEIGVDRLHSATDLLEKVLERAKDFVEQRKLTGSMVMGVPTGLDSLDRLLNGLGTGLYVLGGPPGVGKTTLSLQLAIHAASCKIPTIYVTYENSAQNLILKAVCAEGRISTGEIERGYGDLKALEDAAFSLRRTFSYLGIIEGSSLLEVSDIKAKALQILNQHKCSKCLIIFDYLQRASHSKGYSQLRHNVSALAGELRDLSTRLQSPVLCISSQNRTSGAYGRGGSAALDSLKESGDLEYSADAVLFLLPNESRHLRGGGRAVDLVLAKNRFGNVGSVPLIFNPELGEMREEGR